MVCKICKDSRYLHIGDVVAFGGNKTYHSHGYLKQMAENRGIRVNGKSSKIKAVVLNPNGATKEHLRQAKEISSTVISADDFEDMLKKVCRGTLPKPKSKLPFRKCLGPNCKIYPIDLTPTQLRKLEKLIGKSGAKLTNIRKSSLTAAVASNSTFKSGNADILRFLGVPIYIIERLK